jgi:acyl carrier protein
MHSLKIVGAPSPRRSAAGSPGRWELRPGEPAAGVEAKVSEAWMDVLGTEQVDVHTDFFELGGDSLGAVQIVSRLREWLGCELPLHDFFADPTIAGNSAAIIRLGLASAQNGEADAELSQPPAARE